MADAPLPGPPGAFCRSCGLYPYVHGCTATRCKNPDAEYASRFYVVGVDVPAGVAAGLNAKGLIAPAGLDAYPLGTAAEPLPRGCVTLICAGRAWVATADDRAGIELTDAEVARILQDADRPKP